MPSSYISVNGKAKKVAKAYIGVNGVAKEVESIYFGVSGLTRQVYASGFDEKYVSLPEGNVDKGASTTNNALFVKEAWKAKERTLVGLNKKFVSLNLDNLTNNRSYGVYARSFGENVFFSGGSVSRDYVGTDNLDIYTDSLVHITNISLDYRQYNKPASTAGDEYIVFTADQGKLTTINKDLVKGYIAPDTSYSFYPSDSAETSFNGNAYLSWERTTYRFWLLKIAPNLLRSTFYAGVSWRSMLSANKDYGVIYSLGDGRINSFSKNDVITNLYQSNISNTRSAGDYLVTDEYAVISYGMLGGHICLVDRNLMLCDFDYDANKMGIQPLVSFKQYIITNGGNTSGEKVFVFNKNYLSKYHKKHEE